VIREISCNSIGLDTFRVLESIARTGSLSRAADEIGISQQAVSSRIARAEQLMGRTLVTRRTSGSTLTDDGRLVLGWAGPLLEATYQMDARLEALCGSDDALSIAVARSIADYYLSEWLQELGPLGLRTHLRLASASGPEVIRQVRMDGAQLGFIASPEIPGDLHSVELRRDLMVVTVPPGHPWASRTLVTAKELAATPLVLREPGAGCRMTFERWLAEKGLSMANPVAELDSTLAISEAAAAGVAPAVVSRRAVAETVADNRLVIVTVEGPPIERVLSAIWLTSLLPPLAQALIAIAQRS